jgi:DNA-binding beta-propeller fold protein YncE
MRQVFIDLNKKVTIKGFFCFLIFFSSLFAQVYDTLFIPDSLGGSADLDGFVFNPIMNRIYCWSNRSRTISVLDCETANRLKPIHNMPPHLPVINLFTYNSNNNYLYVASRTTIADSLVYVIDCSTQVVIDTVKADLYNYALPSFDVNIPANKIYLTRHIPGMLESTYTYVIDARTNTLIKRFKSLPYTVHHKIRKVAYNFDTWDMVNPDLPLYIINCENDTIVDSIILPRGSEFDKAFVISEIDHLFISRSDSLIVINCANNNIVGQLQLPMPYILSSVYNPINNKLYVSVPGRTYIIDWNLVQIVDSIMLGVRCLVYNPNTNHLYLVDQTRSIIVIDCATNQVIDEILLPYSVDTNAGYVFHPILNKLYLTNSQNLYIIDCIQRQLEHCFKMAYLNQHMIWQPITNRLYINDICADTFSSILTVYDANSHQPIKVLDLSDYVPPEEWFYHFTTATQVNKIYLTSGHSQGVYVLDGNTDSLINFISCQVGGHYLLYNPNQNKLYTIPFTEFVSPYLYIIDCENDIIRNVINVGESGNGYFNPYNNKIYATISYFSGPQFKVFVIDGIGDTVIKVLDSLGMPLCFRNKGNIHQVYIGSNYQDCIYVFDALTDSLIDSVMNVPVYYDDQFFYYDSIDDRIYYPQPGGIIVIDCAANIIMDTINFPVYQLGIFPEESVWNPISNRFYTCGYDSALQRGKVVVIDCQTNSIITWSPFLLSPSIMQLNTTNNVAYIMDHWASKILAIRDDLIGIEEKESVRNLKELLIYPSIGNKFIIKRKIDEAMTIYDVCGRIVKKIGKEETIIDGKNLTPGVYFIRIDKPKTKNIQKFIVVK